MEVRGREVAGLVPAMAVVRSIAWPLIGLAPVPDLRNPVSGRPELIGGRDESAEKAQKLLLLKFSILEPVQFTRT